MIEQIKVEPYRNFYEAALAFTFDHETSFRRNFDEMIWIKKIKVRIEELYNFLFYPRFSLSWPYGCGLGHRIGAENIKKIFDKYDVHGTWYCTGYALLFGNIQKKKFCNNPILSYATKEANFPQGAWWRSKYPSFYYDPFSNYKKNPEWYFGDQIKRFYESGEDIQSHTFSHLHIALETPDRVDIDLREWQNAAKKLGIPPAKSLAFPWGSFIYAIDKKSGVRKLHTWKYIDETAITKRISNEICEVLVKNGIKVVTRIPRVHQKLNPYRINKIEKFPEIDIFPDTLFNTRTKNIEKYYEEVNMIIKNKGVGSFWCHPGDVFQRKEIKNFKLLVKYAKEKMEEGVLWIAPLTTIWQHLKDIKRLSISIQKIDSKLLVLVKNNNHHPIKGVTIKTPFKIQSVKINNLDYFNFREDKMCLPIMKANETLKCLFNPCDRYTANIKFLEDNNFNRMP